MDKKSIIGIVLTGFIFVGFVIYNSHQQKEYQQKLAEYNAYKAQQETERLAELMSSDAESFEGLSREEIAAQAAAAEQERRDAMLGEALVAAKNATESTVVMENDLLRVEFSSRGGQIKDVTLKEYTKYAPRKERTQPVRMFDPSSAWFDLAFYVKNGTHNVNVNTMEYNFTPQPVVAGDGFSTLVMTLPLNDDAAIEYVYTLYDGKEPSRDYMIDFDVRLRNMSGVMSNQTKIDIEWRNASYQNERGFANENNYTTIAYRYPDEKKIEELRIGDESRDKEVKTSVNWVAFKQQFFSSVFIAGNNFSYARMAYDTARPGSGYIKDFSLKCTVPYTSQTEGYDFAFYFGPNKYDIMSDVVDAAGEPLAMERLIPLGGSLIRWVNRWLVIPVFDFLRQYIRSFGLIIFILAVLVKLIISPLTYKSYLSSAKMRVIKPEMDALNAKYPRPEDMQKKQQAVMDLYRKAGINPMGGCLPLLIQMPVIMAVFRFFPASIELRGQSFLWAHDLSSYDSILDLPFKIPFYGDHVSLFALLMTLTLFAFSYFNYQQTSSGQTQMPGMKFMMVYLMPLISLMWFNSYASGLCFYYFVATLLNIVFTFAIRAAIDDNKIHAQMVAAQNKPRKKSKFQQRYDELMKAQREELERSRKSQRR